MVSEADRNWWLEKARTLKWTFARTYADTAPHEYVVAGRTKGLEAEEYVRAAKAIHTFGQPGKFYDYTNIYLEDDEYRYWTMDEDVEVTDLINRCPVADREKYGPQDAPITQTEGGSTLYDHIATVYDKMWLDPSDLEENREVARLIFSRFKDYAPTTLDVGCGSGLMLDLQITSPAIYTGIDPSQGMLNQLVRKHPNVSRLIPAKAEDVIFEQRRHDLVLATFASASYLSADVIVHMSKLAKRTAIFMTYTPEYLPDYYEEYRVGEPDTAKAARETVLTTLKEMWGSAWSHRRIGEFDTVVIDK